MPVTTGVDVLDRILNGGLPENRTVLATGTPGAGKSTLAMQFLQAGIDAGEQCLFVSTEQTGSELRDSFAPYGYDIDANHLSVRSIHAAPGGGDADYREGSVLKTYGARRETSSKYSLQSLDGDDDTGESIALTPENLREFLFYQESYDRVVLDSASGLRTMAEDDDEFRRILLDMIQLINTEVGATAMFTSETSTIRARGDNAKLAVDDLIQYTVHGVIRMWREEIRGNYRRYLDIMKMRGVDHDDRRFEFTFTEDGLTLIPRDVNDPHFVVANHLPTRIDGLDEMLDGGLLFGSGVLLEHDGQTSIENFLFAVLSSALDQQLSIVLVPRVSTPPRFIDGLLGSLGASMERLLDGNQLFVLDPLGSWYDHDNVFPISNSMTAAKDALKSINERARGRGTLMALNTGAFFHTIGTEDARQLRYWIQARQLSESDILLDIHNPLSVGQSLSAFYLDASTQVVDVWTDDSGLQYVQYRKGLTGEEGGVRHLTSDPEPPYIRVVD